MLVVSMDVMKLHLMISAFAVVLFCQGVEARINRARNLDRYIDAFVTAQFKYSYGCDGAADGSVLAIGLNDAGQIGNPPPEVRDLLNLGARAIPLLIAHLDDTRRSPLTFSCRGQTTRVPVGYVCYDILRHIARDSRPRFNTDCADDGLCACEVEGYCFRPDDYFRRGSRVVPRRIVHRVKSNWERAYRRGFVKHLP